ncbi:MAG: aminopeptidase N [Flavobacteriales bacterium]|jgi:aminopeptidase N
MKKQAFIVLVACALVACKTTEILPTPAPVVVELETAEIVPEKRVYRPTEIKVHDLIHTKLEVTFDWKKQYLMGSAELTLKPYFYPSNRLMLDAKGMDINTVVLVGDEGDQTLAFSYDSAFIDINLGQEFTRFENYTIRIDYVAKPNEYSAVGSEAISDAKGLYFINPDSSEVGKPTQLWTQGETEASSVWFPTIDTPSERMSQEIFITTRKDFQTLSNGQLVYSNFNDDDTRTDYWKQDLEHPPYLTMMAVGDFKIGRDEWQDSKGRIVPVDYYVEPDYANYVFQIFGDTPEMMTFYSQVLNYDYPWDKYAQIVVRDYVSGAMENTTATIHGEFVNQTSRELIDDNNEAVIAHELFHHWFGDLVTCESWSHLPLNESFATYGEYLWFEHKYGQDEADYHSWRSLQGYLNESRYKRVPLIRFDYEDKEDMFDAHSYNKGGQVLHMLRGIVGDQAFFAALNLYLNTNEFKDAEVADLRLAFEETTGMDLNWFFEQWFLKAGHPELDITYFFDDKTMVQQVVVTQTQDLEIYPLFQLPISIDLHIGDKVARKEVMMTEYEQLFAFDVTEKPDWINVDPEKRLLAVINDTRALDTYQKQFANGGNFKSRFDALREAAEDESENELYAVLEDGLIDDFWFIRAKAIDFLAQKDSISDLAFERIQNIVKTDPKTYTKATALEFMGEFGPEHLDEAFLLNCINKELSYYVNAAALYALAMKNPELAISEAKKLENTSNTLVLMALADVYVETKVLSGQSFFETQIRAKKGYDKYVLLSRYQTYLRRLDIEASEPTIALVSEIADGQDTWRVKMMAYRLLGDVKLRLSAAEVTSDTVNPLLEKVNTALREIAAAEENPRLKQVLEDYN